MLSLRKCIQCGSSFDALVGVDKNVCCEKCRTFVESYKKYSDDSPSEAPRRKPPITRAPGFEDVDDDVLRAVYSLPAPPRTTKFSPKPNKFDTLGKLPK